MCAVQLLLFDVGLSGNEGPVRKAEFADLMSKAVNAPGGEAAAGLALETMCAVACLQFGKTTCKHCSVTPAEQ